MKVDIYISEKNGKRSINIPILPEKIVFESGGSVRAEYEIMDKGPVEVHTGSGLRTYTRESELPGQHRKNDSLIRGKWIDPAYYINILEEWRQKGTLLCLMVTGYPINVDVILDDYKAVHCGAFGDISYEIKFIESRDITVQLVTPTENPPKRQDATATTETTSYTVVKGDNLWKIAQNKLGKGSRHTEIYNLNKDIIETTAQKYGKKSSNNGHWLYPGTVLKLPAK
jgi:hypothetical protein